MNLLSPNRVVSLTIGFLIIFTCSTNHLLAQCGAGEQEATLEVIPATSLAVYHGWDLQDDATGTILSSRMCGISADYFLDTVCLISGNSYSFIARDDWGDDWGDGTFEIKTIDGCQILKDSPSGGTFDGCAVPVETFNFTFGDLQVSCPASKIYSPTTGLCGAEVSYPFTKDNLLGCGDNMILQTGGLNSNQRNFEGKNTVATTTNGAVCVIAADLDNDGDQDVISSSQNDDKVAWYQNVGGALGAEQVITTSADLARCIFAADLNMDGAIDIVGASIADNKVAWYENLGGGSFSPEQIISDSADGATDVYVADLNNDGKPDVLSASFNDKKIAWYENLGGGSFSGQKVITIAANGAIGVRAADVDGDGDMDVVSTSSVDNKVAWYENLGGGIFGSQQVISSSIDGARSLNTVDFDFDGDADLLVVSPGNDQIVWFENTGGGYGGPQVIGSLLGPFAAYAEDLDKDGLPDIIASGNADGKVIWYRNSGNGLFESEQLISDSTNDIRGIYAADLDGDSYPEILTASNAGDEVAYYDNSAGTTVFPFGTTTQSYVITNSIGDTETCSFNVVVDGLANSECACAIEASVGTNSFCSNGALNTGDISSCTFEDFKDSWFSYQVPVGMDVLRVSTCGSDFDTGLSIWTACGGSEIACNDDGAVGGGSTCGGSSLQSMIELSGASLTAVEGTTILIRISGYFGSTGCGDLIIDEVTATACDASVAPDNFTAVTIGSTISFSWDAVPASIGCRLEGGPLGSGFPFNQILPGFEVSGANIPVGAVPSGNYQARVQCVCNLSPLSLTPYSNVDIFAVPGFRMAAANIQLYPNPADQVLIVKSTGAANEAFSFVVVDLLGRTVDGSAHKLEGNGEIMLDVSDYPKGAYLLQFTSSSNSESLLFEVVH